MRAALLALGLLTAASLLSGPARAQNVREPREFGDKLLQTLVDGRGEAFLDMLEKDSALGEGPGVQALRDNRPAWARQLNAPGTATGWEYGGYLEGAPSVRVLCYFAKFRNAPLLIEMSFYRSDESWNVGNVAWIGGQNMWRHPCVTSGPRRGTN
ncbi:hypothetical protein [Roseomonas sp. BN140053]|uniref:hypothetical protein n=1 Tax=Roseomonas sp. BN140053 TaxID=3391898 RepID=UPI0039E78978